MQPDLSNIKKRIKNSRDLIDRITTKIPGFKGFVEEKESYEADRIVRDFAADKISSIKKNVTSIFSDLSGSGNIQFLKDLESLNLKLEKIYKKVKFADYGTSASTSSIKISDDDKNRLLEYDWRLIGELDVFDEMIQKLKTENEEEFKTNFKLMKTKIDEFEKSFDDRKFVIMEVL